MRDLPPFAKNAKRVGGPAIVIVLGLGRIVIRSLGVNFRMRILNEIGAGSCANSDRAAFKGQPHSIAIFRRVVDIRDSAAARFPRMLE